MAVQEKKKKNEKFGIRYSRRWGTRLSFYYIYFFFFSRKNLNLYLIPKAKYILQLRRTEGLFFIFIFILQRHTGTKETLRGRV